MDGVTVEYRTAEGEIRGAQAQVLDFDNDDANDWLAVSITKTNGTVVACKVALEGAAGASTADAVYSGPVLGRQAQIAFLNARRTRNATCQSSFVWSSTHRRQR